MFFKVARRPPTTSSEFPFLAPTLIFMDKSVKEGLKGLPLQIDLCENFPGNTEIRFTLVRSLIRQGLYQEALEQVSVFLQMKVNLFRGYLTVAEIYSKMGKYGQSLSWLRLALADGYRDPQIHEKIAYNLMCLKKTEEAQKAFQLAEEQAEAIQMNESSIAMASEIAIE